MFKTVAFIVLGCLVLLIAALWLPVLIGDPRVAMIERKLCADLRMKSSIGESIAEIEDRAHRSGYGFAENALQSNTSIERATPWKPPKRLLVFARSAVRDSLFSTVKLIAVFELDNSLKCVKAYFDFWPSSF